MIDNSIIMYTDWWDVNNTLFSLVKRLASWEAPGTYDIEMSHLIRGENLSTLLLD